MEGRGGDFFFSLKSFIGEKMQHTLVEDGRSLSEYARFFSVALLPSLKGGGGGKGKEGERKKKVFFFSGRGSKSTEREEKRKKTFPDFSMASAAAAEVAGKAASLLKFGAGVYLFRDWLCEPTVVRLEIGERKKKEKRGSR